MLEHLPIGTRDENWYDDDRLIFTISPDVRRKHVAIFGSTGSGKSTLLRNMVAWEVSSGIGATVVDSHGQLVDDILDHHLPSSRAGDVIYLNPKDLTRAIPLNLLDSPRQDLDGLVVDNVMSIFKVLWPDAFPRAPAWRIFSGTASMPLSSTPPLLRSGTFRVFSRMRRTAISF